MRLIYALLFGLSCMWVTALGVVLAAVHPELPVRFAGAILVSMTSAFAGYRLGRLPRAPRPPKPQKGKPHGRKFKNRR